MIAEPDNSILYKSPIGLKKAMDAYNRLLQSLNVPYEMRFVATPSATTCVICAGPADAHPVVLWHGLDASAPTWAAQINALAPKYRVYAPDVPGSMGKSAPVRFDRKGKAYGDWMADTLDALNIERAHMIGISNGGWLILKLATVRPAKIASAILMSSAGFVGARLGLIWKMLPVVALGRFLSPEAQAIRFARAMGSPVVPVAPQDLEMFTVLLGYFKYEQAPGPLSDADLRCLTAPTYILMGEYEAAFTPAAVIRRAKAVLPNLVAADIVARVGHGMITENAEGVNQRILGFLSQDPLS